jgi:hypothetical protein
MAQKHMPPALYKQRLEEALAIVQKHVDHKAIINTNGTGIKYHCYDGHTRQWLPKRDAVTGELFLTQAGKVIDTPQLVRVPKFMAAAAAFKMLEELGA